MPFFSLRTMTAAHLRFDGARFSHAKPVKNSRIRQGLQLSQSCLDLLNYHLWAMHQSYSENRLLVNSLFDREQKSCSLK